MVSNALLMVSVAALGVALLSGRTPSSSTACAGCGGWAPGRTRPSACTR